jgi:RNA polymerase sigma factor (sigma-70 family)
MSSGNAAKETSSPKCQCRVVDDGGITRPENEKLDQLEGIYRLRALELRRVAAAVSGDRGAAADLVQEAFARAVRELQRYEGLGSLEGWLWRILVNAAKNHSRDSRRFVPLGQELMATNGYATGERERVRAAIAMLPDRQRLVLFLRYYADLEYSAIAEALEINIGTVGATLTAARARLAEILLTEEATTHE